jgi:hypothetical protein
MMHDFYAAIQSEAHTARLLVATPLCFRPHRLIHFLDMVRTLSDFPVAKMTVVIHTNTKELGELAMLARLIDGYQDEARKFEVVSRPNLLDRYDLCWQHRSTIQDVFLSSPENYTHFIYLEDDTRFSYLNFCYFLYYREFLRPHRLLPAFIRIEYNSKKRMYYSTDLPDTMDFDTTMASIKRKKIAAGPYAFVPVDNAYMGMYMLDRELAGEFVASRSFDREKSKEVLSWGIPERAAAGLCRENVPPGYLTRYVVPIEPQSLRPAHCAWIYHLPNNFTDWENAANPFGCVPIDAIFSQPPPASDEQTIGQCKPSIPIPGTLVSSFNSDALDATGELREFLVAINSTEKADLRFRHAPRTPARAAAHALKRNVNWFGPGETRAIDVFRDGDFRMQETETLLLHDAVFSPQSTTVCSLRRGFFDASIANFFLVSPTLGPLANNDPLYKLDANGQCVFSERIATLEYVDAAAIPVCGTGFHNYGHFLYDGLPTIHLLQAAIRAGIAEIVGPPLASWQREVLDLLGLSGRYRALHAPALFRSIVVSSHISFHVPYPTRFVRPVFDTLRFIVGGPFSLRTRKIFVSRLHDTSKRVLVNRDEVEELFQQAGFEIVDPEKLTIVEQIRLFASAVFVAGESGAGMANIGFCDPGTRVLEIQPEAFVEGWTRAACMLFGHEWGVFFAKCMARTESDRAKPSVLEFRVDITEMRAVIENLV